MSLINSILLIAILIVCIGISIYCSFDIYRCEREDYKRRGEKISLRTNLVILACAFVGLFIEIMLVTLSIIKVISTIK